MDTKHGPTTTKLIVYADPSHRRSDHWHRGIQHLPFPDAIYEPRPLPRCITWGTNIPLPLPRTPSGADPRPPPCAPTAILALPLPLGPKRLATCGLCNSGCMNPPLFPPRPNRMVSGTNDSDVIDCSSLSISDVDCCCRGDCIAAILGVVAGEPASKSCSWLTLGVASPS